jgi:hypothetical protein
VRILVSTAAAAAVLATAFVGVRLHLEVTALRYRLGRLAIERDRAERELRLAIAEYETAKAPRRLLERWSEVQAAREAALAVGVAPPDLGRRTATPLTPVVERAPIEAERSSTLEGLAGDDAPDAAEGAR